MKDKLSIGEFARLRNITTETLRHYDRIGLLKPIEVDTNTGYRYYSILQDEKLGTIKELRRLGMSIDDIKVYFDNRNLQQSINMLKDNQYQLRKKINELQQLEESISEKIDHLEEISQVSNIGEIVIKELKEREIIAFDKPIKSEIELGYAFPELENSLKEVSPVLGSNRIGFITKVMNSQFNRYSESVIFFLFINENKNIEKKDRKKIKKGTYACAYFKGNVWDKDHNIDKMIQYIEKEGYQIHGDILQIIQIDVSVTDQSEESLYEIQVPITKVTTLESSFHNK